MRTACGIPHFFVDEKHKLDEIFPILYADSVCLCTFVEELELEQNYCTPEL